MYFSRLIRLAVLSCLAAFGLLLPSGAAASPAGACTLLQGQVVCMLDATPSAGALLITGTNFDTAVDAEVVFDDGTSFVYHKTGTQPNSATVNWAIPGTVTRAMLDAYTGPSGFKRQAERELGMSAGQPTGIGQAIQINDAMLSGKVITEIRLYDVTKSRATSSLNATVSAGTGGTWVPPLITVSSPEPNKVVISAPAGLNSVERFEMTCTAHINPTPCSLPTAPATTTTTIRANKSGATNLGLVAGSLSWSDTQVTFRSDFLSGREIKFIQGKKLTLPTGTADYDLSPDLYMAPVILSAAGTGALDVSGNNAGEFKFTGGEFRLLQYAIITLDTGQTRLIGIKTGVTGDSGTSVQTLGSSVMTLRDTGVIGHTINRVDLYYRDGAGQETLVASHTTPFYVKGSLSSVTSGSASSATLNGSGLQAVVSVVFTLSDGGTLSFATADFDSQSFSQLTITDSQLAGVTITGATATTADGQTMSITGLNTVVASPPPPPNVIIDDMTSTLTGDDLNLVFSATGAAITSVTCQLDAGAQVACASPAAFANLAVGDHTVIVRATNSTGTGSDSHTVTVAAPTGGLGKDFIANMQYNPDLGNFQLTKTTAGGVHTPITTDAAWGMNFANEFPVWSADRNTIAFAQHNGYNSIDGRVMVVNTSTGAVTTVRTGFGYVASGIEFLDNDTIIVAMTSGAQWYQVNLFSVDIDGSNLTQLTNFTGLEMLNVRITAAAGKIVYLMNDNNTGNSKIMRMNEDGSGVEQLGAGISGNSYSPILTADGSKLVYRSSVDNGGTVSNTTSTVLNVMDTATQSVTQVTPAVDPNHADHNFGAFNVVLSPDEDRIGFACMSNWLPPAGTVLNYDYYQYEDQYGNPVTPLPDYYSMCSVKLDGTGLLELGPLNAFSGDRSFYGADGRLYTQGADTSWGIGVFSFADDQAGQTATLAFSTTWNQVIGGAWYGTSG